MSSIVVVVIDYEWKISDVSEDMKRRTCDDTSSCDHGDGADETPAGDALLKQDDAEEQRSERRASLHEGVHGDVHVGERREGQDGVEPVEERREEEGASPGDAVGMETQDAHQTQRLKQRHREHHLRQHDEERVVELVRVKHCLVDEDHEHRAEAVSEGHQQVLQVLQVRPDALLPRGHQLQQTLHPDASYTKPIPVV